MIKNLLVAGGLTRKAAVRDIIADPRVIQSFKALGKDMDQTKLKQLMAAARQK